MQRSYLFFILVLSALVGILNIVALKFDLYYSFWWADIIMHTLGGATMAAVAAVTLRNKFRVRYAILFVLFIGIAWEILEVSTGMTSVRDRGFISDTLGDLCFDIVGAYAVAMFWSPINLQFARHDARQ